MGPINVSIDEHIASLMASATDDQKACMRHTSINHDTLEKALLKLNKGAAPGIDGMTRDDLLAFPREALDQTSSQELNGSPVPTGMSWQAHHQPFCPNPANRTLLQGA